MKKKILLIRDYSGMLSQLSRSLSAYGFDVVHASTADAFKGSYGCNIDLESKIIGIKIIDLFLNYLKLAFNGDRYDVIHLQAQLLGGPYSIVLIPIIWLLRRKCIKLTVSLAGDDFNYWEYGPRRLKYGPFVDSVAIDLNGKTPYYKNIFSKCTCQYVEKIASHLIPACYEYAISHQGQKNLTDHVPFIWDVKNTPFQTYDANNKRAVRIFHGISRKGFKGSAIILDALQKLKDEYGDDVDLVLPEKIPYSDYKQCLIECDIFIDQCNSYSYGMAAIEALALGKVVLSGAEHEALDYMKIQDCPVINIVPESSDIFLKLKRLINHRNELTDIGIKSRQFVERYHTAENVIPKLCDIWFGEVVSSNIL